YGGFVAINLMHTEIHVFHAKAVFFGTGGFGRIFKITSNALALTGDGVIVPARRGVPLEDMEFFQFHPTGIYRLGILISEAARGEGGILLNNDGERFMERYAPTLKDLAPRDIVSRCMFQEIKEGRGIGGKDYVHLDLRHLGRKVLDEKMADFMQHNDLPALPPNPDAFARDMVDRLLHGNGTESAAAIRSEMQQLMFNDVFVVRNAAGLQQAAEGIRGLKERYARVAV